MSLQVGDLCEGLGAARVGTLVRFLASVNSEVLLQGRVLSEMFSTLFERTFIFHLLTVSLQNSLGGSLIFDKTVHVFWGYGMGVLLLL